MLTFLVTGSCSAENIKNEKLPYEPIFIKIEAVTNEEQEVISSDIHFLK